VSLCIFRAPLQEKNNTSSLLSHMIWLVQNFTAEPHYDSQGWVLREGSYQELEEVKTNGSAPFYIIINLRS
jgi:hypothetical protein